MAIMQTLWQELVSKILYIPLFVFFTLHSFFLYVRSLGGFCSVDQSTKAPKNESGTAFKRSSFTSNIPMSCYAPNTPCRNHLKESRVRYSERAQHQAKQGRLKYKKPGPMKLENTDDGSNLLNVHYEEVEAQGEKMNQDLTPNALVPVSIADKQEDSCMRPSSVTPISVVVNPSSFSTPTVVNTKSLSPSCQAQSDSYNADLNVSVTETGDLDGRSDTETPHSAITNPSGSGQGTPIGGHPFFSGSEMKGKDNVKSDRYTPSSGCTSPASSPRMRDERTEDDLGSDLEQGQNITTNSGTKLVRTQA